ncbi:hypothetical protein DH2020_013963 [Rehmannia glutinosa]|uniref:UDP-N-acetylglucosamine--dolichyl-phosphate N-acetylglucosaminephosphotransferase n=1 Tax=Rehmannia glutinosa TaxID=99300 RepID=A0ABR0WV00_REHGL
MAARKRGSATTETTTKPDPEKPKPENPPTDPPIRPAKFPTILKFSLIFSIPYFYSIFSHNKIDYELKKPIVISAFVSIIGFFVTVKMIPVASKYVLRRNLFGYDINKKGTLMDPLKFYFSRIVRPESLALASICFMILLGFVDDVLDVPWRVKLVLPSIAALPLLMAYAGHTSIIIPKPLVPYILIHNIMQIGASTDPEYKQAHAFSIYLVQPLLATSLALLSYNWYPSSVFVGDTYTYFAGMTMAVAGILGHFSWLVLYPVHGIDCQGRFDPQSGLLTGTNDGTLVNLFLRQFGRRPYAADSVFRCGGSLQDGISDEFRQCQEVSTRR